MMERVEKFIKAIAVFMLCFFVMVIGLMLWISHIMSQDKDLVKNNSLKNAIIEQNDLVFEIQEGYASGLDIGYDSQTVYSQGLGKKYQN
ncbi:hypothetical protein [Moraxella lacunata]|uniref:hypothetical protein n=1 Tax=Moraxella lacunata TaxID=477 RepID=UPI0024ACB47A|nr:hypothetical protein [Moraxella lacunata]MDI4507207.1 hypothetical protein [Moraxella lacunata]